MCIYSAIHGAHRTQFHHRKASFLIKLPPASSPCPSDLILTHILQMDFVKWPIKPSRMAGCITTSTISFRSTSEPKKMWVRISPSRRVGFLTLTDRSVGVASAYILRCLRNQGKGFCAKQYECSL